MNIITIPAPILGRDQAGGLARLSLADNPHIAVIAPASGGKTTIARGLARQLAEAGAELHVIAPKGWPGIPAAWTPDTWLGTMHDVESQMRARYERRAEHIPAPGDDRPLVLVIDDANDVAAMLHHARLRIGQPMRPPLSSLLLHGHVVGCHVLLTCPQLVSVARLCGRDARDMFARVAVGSFSAAHWRLMFGASPRPQSWLRTLKDARKQVMVGACGYGEPTAVTLDPDLYAPAEGTAR